MTWNIRQKYLSRLARETGTFVRGWGGGITVCLVYPNHYPVAMSSLGFQTVYGQFNAANGFICERAFLPDRDELKEYRSSGTPLLSLETQHPLAEFDVIAFSVSFELDYQNIPVILELAGIPAYSSQRSATHPLVLAGGAAFSINPEPVADFLDVICIGEAEAVLPGLAAELTSPEECDRGVLLTRLASLPGVYIPSCYQPLYHDGKYTGYKAAPEAPQQVMRQCPPLEGCAPAASVITGGDTEFGDLFLVEVSRGCPRGCRFCTSGFTASPFRWFSAESVRSAMQPGFSGSRRIGLVGAAVSDHPDIAGFCRSIVEQGGKVSLSSLRLDRLDPDILDCMAKSGHKTIAIAPEGGSQRLRDLVGKNLTEEQILTACELIISHDILNIRLYVIIGLPTETDGDLTELLRLVGIIRERVICRAKANKRLGEIILSVNPFIPKPGTPLQWCGMEQTAVLKKRLAILEKGVQGMSNVRIKAESLKESYLQTLFSRGDRRVARLLELMAQGETLKKGARLCGIDPDDSVYRTIGLDEPLPWDIIGGADRVMLRREYETAGGFA